jgi:HK97 family phage major capsid protein/HK97 family phage prohead protease
MVERAYSVLTIKSVDAERRVITGIATTPTPDRVGDVVEPRGAQFAASLPLLLYHDSRLPVGTATFGKATDSGIPFTASFPVIDEPGTLRDRVSEAWSSVKAGLIRGVSIGFRVLDDGIEALKSGGLRFTKTEILELSLVAIPANAEATILSIKSLDSAARAASGQSPESPNRTFSPGVSGGTPVRLAQKGATPMKNIAERKQAFAAEKAAKVAKMNEIVGSDDGATMSAEAQDQFDTIVAEIKSIDEHLSRLETLEQVNKANAVPVAGKTQEEGTQSRSGQAPVITVKANRPPGIGMARVAIAKYLAAVDGMTVREIVDERWPDDSQVKAYFQKATVPAGSTTNSTWAGNLVDTTNLAGEFVDYLRPQTIIGRIPGLTRVPFNVRFTGQSTGAVANWVGQGKAKPVTSFSTTADTLLFTKIAAIAVITDELARYSSPNAETMVRNELARAVVEREDIDFIDPASAASSGVNPASITNGLTPLSSAGTSADNIRTDIQNLLEYFILNNVNPTGLVLVMPNTLALAAMILRNSLGQPEFPELTMTGGTLMGIPVITSQYAANQSGSGNIIVALNAPDIYLADDGNVSLSASREASIEMSDAPSGDSVAGTGASLVSMFQTNSIAIRAERSINWAKRRSTAVVYMDDVNWGSIGSPS